MRVLSMLDINPDIVCRLIELAREFHAQEEVVIPEIVGNPSGDWATQTLAGHLDDMTLQEFKSIVRDLEPNQQHQVVALFWVGRGDLMLMSGKMRWNKHVMRGTHAPQSI